ncbi:unnamed protein product, partial [Rotaria sp. Silwood2]
NRTNPTTTLLTTTDTKQTPLLYPHTSTDDDAEIGSNIWTYYL